MANTILIVGQDHTKSRGAWGLPLRLQCGPDLRLEVFIASAQIFAHEFFRLIKDQIRT